MDSFEYGQVVKEHPSLIAKTGVGMAFSGLCGVKKTPRSEKNAIVANK